MQMINAINPFRKYHIFIYLFAICYLIVDTGSAQAHSVSVFAWVEGNTVFVESKFSGGRKIKKATVKVYDVRGTKILEGPTNEWGKFSFKVPKKTELRIVLMDGLGHQAEWTIPEDEIEILKTGHSDPHISSQSASEEIYGPPSVTSTAKSRETALQPEPIGSQTLDDIQIMIERALDKKLKPVMEMIAESAAKKITVTDILSGIGYIFGLVGVATYFQYRRRKE
jgi:nickel transport protein